MSAPRVVPASDEVEHGEACLGRCREPLPVEQLALERGEEALTQGVVVGVAHAAHRRPDAGLATPATEGKRRVLGGFMRSSQHLTGGSCDDDAETAMFRSIWARQVAIARPTLGGTE